MKVKREDFLNQLESVRPGLSPRELIEQSSCIIFQKGMVYTYNDEISCSQKLLPSLRSIEGAVHAIPLLNLLNKMKEDIIGVSVEKSILLIKGKNRRAGIRMDENILLPIEAVDEPKEWQKLPNDFSDAISLVQSCAGTNESEFARTCIHLHPEWIEACNNYQAARYTTKLPFEKSILARKDSLTYIISANMTDFSSTESWIHFRNKQGLIISCRKFVEDYPEIGSILEVKGRNLSLPKGLKEASEKAAVFSEENTDDNRVAISIETNKLEIKGTGASGWFKEKKQIKYEGKPLKFTIEPGLLSQLVQKYNDCQVAKNRLKITFDKFEYITVLGKIN